VGLNPVPALHLRFRSPARKVGQGSITFATQHALAPTLTVRIFDEFETGTPGAVTSSSGDWAEISGIAAGHYKLNWQLPDGNSATREIDVAGDIELDIKQLSFSAPVTVSGLVKAEGITTFPRRAFLRLQGGDSNAGLGGEISEKGEFRFQGTITGPGNYQVLVFGLPGLLVTALAANGAKATGHSLQLNGGESVRLAVLMSKGMGQVNGVVLRDDKPISQAMVVLAPQDPETSSVLFRRDQSDSDGTFTLPRVVPGRYTVLALENGWDMDWANSAVLKPYLNKGTKVQVGADQTYEIKVQVQ
jgi:hypothetical protein